MEFLVIIERRNDHYRAVIPALADLSAEGSTNDEAVQNVQRAAEEYLATVELKTIHIPSPQRYSIAQDLLKVIGDYRPFDELQRFRDGYSLPDS